MNKSFSIVVLLLFLSCFLISCSKSSSAMDQEASIGKVHFVGYGCNTCHLVGSEGGVLGPNLTTIGFRKSPEWLDLWLKNPSKWKHDTVMPNFYIKDNIRQSLVAYLSSLKGEIYRDGDVPWNHESYQGDAIKRGEAVYKHIGCVGCHGMNGKGGYPNNNVVGGLIPSLTLVADGYSKEELKDKIRKGSRPSKADPNGPEPMIFMPEWKKLLKDDELDDLVEYLFSLRPEISDEDAWD